MTKVIFTQNSLRRIHEDNLSQGIIYDVLGRPDKKYPGRQPGTIAFQKALDFGSVVVIAKQTKNGEWLVISCFQKRFSHSPKKPDYSVNKDTSFLEKILMSILKTIGFK